jgi:hypothetical protein
MLYLNSEKFSIYWSEIMFKSFMSSRKCKKKLNGYLFFTSCPELSEELDGLAVSPLRRAVAEVKQYWSGLGWVTKN